MHQSHEDGKARTSHPIGQISRRSFLKAAFATGATGTLALTGCALPTQAYGAERPTPEGYDPGPVQPDYDYIRRCACAPNCTNSCGINAFVKDDTIIKVEPADFPDKSYNRICLCGISNAMQRVYSADRVKYPMKRVGERGEGKWERISWEEAMDLIYEKMTYNIEHYGPTSNSWMTMEGNYAVSANMFASMMASTYDGTMWANYALMSDYGSGMAWNLVCGSAQSADWSDMMGSKTIIMFGCNYTETLKQDMHFVFDAQEAGAKLVVIDPRFSRTAAKADWWIPIRPGTDAALLLAMTNYVIANDKMDLDYVLQKTTAPYLVNAETGQMIMQDGNYLVWDEEAGAAVPVAPVPDAVKPVYPSEIVNGPVPTECLVPATAALTGHFTVETEEGRVEAYPAFVRIAEVAAEYTPEAASEICDIPADDIIELSRLYAEETPAKIQQNTGSNRYYNGHLPYRASLQLAALTGNLGKEHANVSWAGGTLNRVLSGINPAVFMPREGHFPQSLPATKWMDIVTSEDPCPIKLIWFQSYGWGTQGPFSGRVLEEVLPKIDFIITSEQVLTSGAQLSDLVLPITSWYEEPIEIASSWTNMYLQMRRQVISPMYEAKTDYEVGQMLAERFGILEETMWATDIEDWLRVNVIEANSAPEISGIDFDEFKESQVVRTGYADPYIPYADGVFPTPSGKVELYTDFLAGFGEETATFYEPLESARSEKAAEFPLTFMNTHTVYSAHSQHMNLPWIREVMTEPWIEISVQDAAERGIESGDAVRVFNDRGEYKVRALVTEEVQPGVVNNRQGWWAEHFIEGHFRDLLHMTTSPVQEAIYETNFAPYDNLVQIEKA